MIRKQKHSEQGMVSLLVTLIMMIVISLIVLGFAQVTRHNQREALDRQLSTAAYYAAESGVNYAANAIKSALSTGSTPPSSSTCEGFFPSHASFVTHATLDSSSKTSFTCLTVDNTPPSLVATPLNLSSNVIWHIQDSDPTATIHSLTFTWAPDPNITVAGGPYCSAAANTFPSGNQWTTNYRCNFPVLRVDLVQSPGVVSGASALAQKTITLYLKPSTSGSISPTLASDFTTSGQRAYILRCNVNSPLPADKTCAATFFLSAPAGTDYYARITTMYANTGSVQLSGTQIGGSGSTLHFTDGQAVIDSTGKSQDELRRLQVRVPLTIQAGSSELPNLGVASTGSICKELTVGPSIYKDASIADHIRCP